MGLAATKKKQPPNPPSTDPATHHVAQPDSGQPTFFRHLIKVAGITRKEIQYDLRVSKTLVDLWLDGTKHDPLKRARDTVGMFLRKGQSGLLPSILLYIAGDDEFDGMVLTAEQFEALKVLSKAAEGK